MDRYTKAVLTVIAAALCALVAQNAVGPLQAQSPHTLQRVVICDASGENCAGVIENESNSLYGALKVRGLSNR